MIFDAETGTLLANIGWVDQGSLWRFDLSDQSERLIAIEGARYLHIESGIDGLFRLIHHESTDACVSIRHFARPDLELASIRADRGGFRLAGDAALWDFVPPAMIVQTGNGPRLLYVDTANATVVEIDLGWFNDAEYDLDYQGIVGCLLLNSGLIAVAIQRSSDLVLIDPVGNRRAGAISLAGRGGNPTLRLLSGNEFLASDYDCLCLVDAGTGLASCSPPLQETGVPGYQEFVGDYDIRNRTCAVARPFSSDVLLLDLPTFEIQSRASVAGQPLQVCLTSDSHFVTRDWKTGVVAMGAFGTTFADS